MTPPYGQGVDEVLTTDMVVVGTGVAGLRAALGAARGAALVSRNAKTLAAPPTPTSRRVALLTKSRLGFGGSSPWAQGGVAAAVAPGDSPELHAEDTLAAAAELADAEIVCLLTRAAPAEMRRIAELGVRFDRDRGGAFALGREGAHSRARILHADGDATGAELVRGLVAAVRAEPAIEVRERAFACELALERGRVVGVLARQAGGRRVLYLARAVVLATGGCGRLFEHTTNPPEATGDGLAMAARAGARLADLEFMQFHPTALAVGADPMPLATEALRGAGAVLVDGRGRAFMAQVHPAADLAPRDVVARASWQRLEAGERVLLDARRAVGESFPRRFPTVYRFCREHGLDPRREPMPVSPAAHYSMGGVWVDADGRTSLPGLWACGEVTSSGVHGANRLASNSLLEALVFGARVAADVERRLPELPPVKALLDFPGGGTGTEAEPELSPPCRLQLTARLRRLMWRRVGLVRDGAGLRRALREIAEIAAAAGPGTSELHNLLTVARLMTRAALQRRESRGSHFRSDHPETLEGWRRRLFWRGEEPEVEERAAEKAGAAR